MKKRLLALFLSSLLLASLAGCSGKKETDIHKYDDMTLQEYLDKHDLPKNLSYSFVVDEVSNRTSAKNYTAEYVEFDLEILKQKFLHFPVAEEDPSFVRAEEGDKMESIMLNNGSMGGDQGGFMYGGYSPLEYMHYHTDLPNDIINGQNFTYDDIVTAPPKWKDLDFMPYEDASAKVLDELKELRFPEDITLQNVLSLDLESLNRGYDYEVQQIERGNSENDPGPQPEKKDEAYILHYRQMVDGLPVDNYNQSMRSEYALDRTAVIAAVYNQEGFATLYARGMMKNLTETDEVNIISAASAMNLLNDYLSQGILTKEYNIESFELTYHQFYDSETNELTLRPYWFIRIAYPFSVNVGSDSNEDMRETSSYQYIYIDATTGKLTQNGLETFSKEYYEELKQQGITEEEAESQGFE